MSFNYRPRTTISSSRSTGKNSAILNERISTTSKINAELSNQTFSGRSKSRFGYQAYPSRLGKFSLQDKLDRPFKTMNPPRSTNISEEEQNEEQDKLFMTFDLLKTMTPKNTVKYLSNNPLFLRVMFLEGKLDPEIISTVAISLTQNELQRFMLNMTQELNFYSAIATCDSFSKIENQLSLILPIENAYIWVRPEHSDFILSTTLKKTVQISKTIIGAAFEGEEIITGDPSNHPKFSIDNDLTILRGAQSMAIFPIKLPTDDVIGALQCIGFKNILSGVQTEFPIYYIETLKIVRDLIQKRFFQIPTPQLVPSSATQIFNEIDKCSFNNTAAQICKYLQQAFPCELAELYEFDDRYRQLIRIPDRTKFGEKDGGIPFQAGISTVPINIAHGQPHSYPIADIDTQMTNRSILARSILQGREHFVIVLRSKPNFPSFDTTDVRLITDLSPLIADALKLSRWLEKQQSDVEEIQNGSKILNVICSTLSDVASTGTDRWKSLQKASMDFFGSSTLFVCIFDGRYMIYTPTDIKCKFEDCVAGAAYNYRETVIGKKGVENSKYNAALYQELDVNCTQSLAFPYRANGRVCGAIEIINPTIMPSTQEKQKLFSNLAACLLSNATSIKS